MTPQDAIAALWESLDDLKDACCIHTDEFGDHYAPGCQENIVKFEAVIETLEALVYPEEAAS